MVHIVLFTHPPYQSIYEVTALQMQNWHQNRRFCIFGPRLALIMDLYAPLRVPNT